MITTTKIPKLPPSFLAFQKKCNELVKTDEDKLFIRDHLQKLKEDSIKMNKFYLTNWLSHPVPELPSSKQSQQNQVTGQLASHFNQNQSQKHHQTQNQTQMQNKNQYQNKNKNQNQNQFQNQFQNKKKNLQQVPTSGQQQIQSQQKQKTKKDRKKQAQQQKQIQQHQHNQLTQENYMQQMNVQFASQNNFVQHDQIRQSIMIAGNKKRKREDGADNRQSKKKVEQVVHQFSATLPSLEGLKAKPLVGTCKDLEKDYVRLTSDPDPSIVRPQSVLEQTLKLLKHKYINEQADYTYMCSQMKSMRQDLTVQCIRNEFTVRVYESHARISLQHGDLDQFNQCQGQLKSLYAQGIPGNMQEFTAYRLMYNAFVKNYASLTADLRELGESTKKDPLLIYAMRVIRALNEGNMHLLFGELLENAPKMSEDLILAFAPKLRENYFFALAKSHSPTSLPREFVQRMLGLLSNTKFNEFMKKYNLPPSEISYSSKEIMAKIREYRNSQGD